MLRCFATWVFTCLLAWSHAQELIPNPDFKQVNRCCEYGVSCAPMGWWTAHGGTFNFKPNTFDRNGQLEYQPAYIRLRSDVPGHRSYIQAPILCPLIKGHQYTLSITIQAESYLPGELGIYFSDSFLNVSPKMVTLVDSVTGLFRTTRIDSILPFNPDEQLDVNTRFFRRGLKQTLKLKYTASGSERFLIIGNFNTDKRTIWFPTLFPLVKSENTLLRVYEVSLTPTHSTDHCDTRKALEVLDHINRRHSYYAGCSDTSALNMDRIFTSIPAWKRVYDPQTNSRELTTENQLFNQPFVVRNIHFAFDSSTLLTKSYSTLDSLIGVIDSLEIGKMEIIGHTDSLGDADYNLILSRQRAEAVKSYLLDQRPNLKLEAMGKGATTPIADNGTPEGRALNRRVEFIFRLRSNQE